MNKIRVHVYISGRVQGVGYRYSTVHQAQSLELTGWVKNTYDRKVEAIFEGDENAVEQMLKWCQNGPSMAFVTNIEIHKSSYTGKFNSFVIKG
ncbi:MAG: acylphosphatase [Candidatus Gastranaerophilales bacterium]|nr:acylphosphatase [Candidatus Gastranaerophilales bacterium]